MFEAKFKNEDGDLFVRLEGWLDALSSMGFTDELKTALNDARSLTMDAGGLEYVSSAGLRTLLAAQLYLQENGLPDLRIINVGEMLAEIFSTTGFDTVVDIEAAPAAEPELNHEDYLLEASLKRRDPQLHKRMTESIFTMQNMLRSFLNRFPSFTDHSVLHSMNVIYYCNSFIGKDRIDSLAPEECYALIMACYLHDIGMGINERDLKLFVESQGCSDELDFDDSVETASFVRNKHHEISGFLIRKYSQIFDFPSEELMHAVIQISRGHRKVDLFDPEEYADIRTDDAVIRTACLSAVHRIADEMDVANDRNPDFLFDTSGLTDINDIEAFGTHESILSVEINEDEIILHVRPKAEEFIPLVEKAAAEIQKKLDYCRAVAEARSEFRISQTRVVLKQC